MYCIVLDVCVLSIPPELIPKSIELLTKGADQVGVIGDNNVLSIIKHGTSGPIERAIEENILIYDGELVMHVRHVSIISDLNALCLQSSSLAAPVVLLVVVGDDPDTNPSLLGLYDLVSDFRACDCEDTHI